MVEFRDNPSYLVYTEVNSVKPINPNATLEPEAHYVVEGKAMVDIYFGTEVAGRLAEGRGIVYGPFESKDAAQAFIDKNWRV